MRKIRRREELCNAMVSKSETLFWIIEYLLGGGSSKHFPNQYLCGYNFQHC